MEPGNVRAWDNYCDVLLDAFSEMHDFFLNLDIIFEYCMPRRVTESGPDPDSHIWADAVIVSQNMAVVLEFKQFDKAIIQRARQAKMYRTRLQKYHNASFGMRKWAVLIPTHANSLLSSPTTRVTACSPDCLAEVLRAQFGESPHAHKAIDSSFSAH